MYIITLQNLVIVALSDCLWLLIQSRLKASTPEGQAQAPRGDAAPSGPVSGPQARAPLPASKPPFSQNTSLTAFQLLTKTRLL